MKRSGPAHPKVALFAAALGVEKYAAVGLLELLWHFTAQYAPQGDVGRYANAAIADAVGWRDEPQRLVDALVQCRLVDQDPTHRLLVHGWHEHADQAVQRALARRGETFVTTQKRKRKVTSRRLASELDVSSLARGSGNGSGLGSGGGESERGAAGVESTLLGDARALIAEINRVGGKSFSDKTQANLDFARARLGEYPLAQLLAMIRWRWRTWDAAMRAEYFRPETLLNATKCASYVGGMPASEWRNGAPVAAVQPTALALKFAERDRLKAAEKAASHA